MEVFRPLGSDLVAFIEEPTVMAKGLKELSVSLIREHRAEIQHTLGPSGPSRTAHTAVPQTMQLLHLQLCRSL